MFAYCSNNPINRHDPSGKTAVAATVGGVAVWKLIATLISLITAVIVADSITKNPPTLPPVSIPKIEIPSKNESKTESKSETKDIVFPKLPAKDPVHHIVAKADPRAAESRQILIGVGIDPVTDPRNLVVLPQSYHVSLHTTAYHNYVTEQLRSVAGDKAGVEATLALLKAEILARSAAGIRWE